MRTRFPFGGAQKGDDSIGRRFYGWRGRRRSSGISSLVNSRLGGCWQRFFRSSIHFIADTAEFLVSKFQETGETAETPAYLPRGAGWILVFEIMLDFCPGVLKNGADLYFHLADFFTGTTANSLGIDGEIHDEVE